MKRYLSRVRRPVRRGGAERYILITLLTFAASVALTRLFLELTNYPQLGGGGFHIAHVLWGGLFLFAASLLPLILANRWVFGLSSILAGIGVGLFIDEVGKFITQTNDYFYPAAAPIIYAFFLLTVLLYIQVKRPPAHDARAELYRALGALQELLDRDLEPSERDELQALLDHIAAKAEHPDLKRLAKVLRDFLDSDALRLAPEKLGFLDRLLARAEAFEDRWLTQNRLKGMLAGGLFSLGGFAIFSLVQILVAARDPLQLQRMVGKLVAAGRVATASGMGWFSARIALEGAAGLILIIAATLLLVGKDRAGSGLAFLGLLLSLAAVNLLVFYFEQFSTIILAMVQFVILLGTTRYRLRFLNVEGSAL